MPDLTPPSDFDHIRYMKMFHLSDDLEIKIQQNIGPQKKSVVVIDNFYKDPDAVRQLCLESKKKTDPGLLSYMPGHRVFIETAEVRKKLYPLFEELCFDTNIWGGGNWQNLRWFQAEWQKCAFICNVINDKTLADKPMGIIPHQDAYRLQMPPLHTQFAAVIYLNTPEECSGGTNLYSYGGEISHFDRPESGIPVLEDPSQVELFDHIKSYIDNSIEHTFEMVYNRMVLYEADVLHGPSVELGKFKNFSRINQVLFM